MASSKSSKLKTQFVRYQTAFLGGGILIVSLFLYINIAPKAQEYLLKINITPLDEQIASDTLLSSSLSDEANKKQQIINERTAAYQTRLDVKAPKIVDYYKLVRYFDNLAFKYGSQGQLFEVDSVTISEIQSSLGRGNRNQNTTATTVEEPSYDFVTVQLPMRVSVLNLSRFIDEIYKTKDILPFLQDEQDTASIDDPYVAPFMRLEQLSVTPQQNENGSGITHYNANATISVYFQPYTADEVKETLKTVEATTTRLREALTAQQQAIQPGTTQEVRDKLQLRNTQLQTAIALTGEARTLLESNPREAQVKARSAQLILADIEAGLTDFSSSTPQQ